MCGSKPWYPDHYAVTVNQVVAVVFNPILSCMEQILPTNEGVEMKQKNTVKINLYIFIKAYNCSTGSEIHILHQSFTVIILCKIYIASKVSTA